jgi:hypothetical protein
VISRKRGAHLLAEKLPESAYPTLLAPFPTTPRGNHLRDALNWHANDARIRHGIPSTSVAAADHVEQFDHVFREVRVGSHVRSGAGCGGPASAVMSEKLRRGNHRIRAYAATPCGIGGLEGRNRGAQRLDTVDVAPAKIHIMPTFAQDNVNQRCHQCDIFAGQRLQEEIRMARRLGAARIDDDEAATALFEFAQAIHRVLQREVECRQGDQGIGPHEHQHLGIVERILSGSPAAKALERYPFSGLIDGHRRKKGGGTDRFQPIRQHPVCGCVGIIHRTPKSGDGIRAVAVNDRGQLTRDFVQCAFKLNAFEAPVGTPLQRMQDAVRAVNRFVRIQTLDTCVTLGDRIRFVAADAGDPLVGIEREDKAALASANAAGGDAFLHRTKSFLSLRELHSYRVYYAKLNTVHIFEYVAKQGMLMGIAIALGSAAPWLVIPLFMWQVTVRFVVPEEHKLQASFGGEYLRYIAKVRRWV